MASLVKEIVAGHGANAVNRELPFSLDEVRALLEQDFSIEDPQRPLGQAAKQLRPLIHELATHVYELRPEWLDAEGYSRLESWADEHYPAKRPVYRDLDDHQVDRILKDLRLYLNENHVAPMRAPEL